MSFITAQRLCKQGRQQCPTMPAAVVPASGLASAVVYCAQPRQRKEDGLGVGRLSRARIRELSMSHLPPRVRAIDLARMSVTADS
jgi:hypothetical protein